ncbi:MAG: hypothetical protein QW802_00685 [Candidatus Altiarchaeota archaeon]
MPTQAISYATANIVSTEKKGAAFTINIPVKVTTELTNDGKILITKKELKKIAEKTLLLLKHKEYGLKIKIKNEIPDGLGREEATSLALTFSIAGEIAKKYGSINELKIDKFLSEQFLIIEKKFFDKKKLLELCIKENEKLKFEKLATSFYGGFSVTDNSKREILRRGDIEELFLKLHKLRVRKQLKIFESELEKAWDEALKGNLYTAMKINALLLNENSKKFVKNEVIAISYSPPYLIEISREKKYGISSINSPTKILEKPMRIYKVKDFLKIENSDEFNIF